MITTQSLNILTILSDIYSGRIRIPDFQRNIIWDADDAGLLLDSIYKNYPLGSFLLWETNSRIKERNPLHLDVPDRRERLYLIDGQQRSIVLYGVFNDQLVLGDDPERDSYRAYFNLTTEEFNIYNKKFIEKDPSIINPNEIPLHEALIFDLERRNVSMNPKINEIIMEEQNVEKNLHYSNLIRTFTNYIVGGIIVQGVDLPEACEIFVRMNKSGVELNVVDLMVARTYSDEPLFNLREKLDEFNAEKGLQGYSLSPETILQCVSACLIGGITRNNILQSANNNNILNHWERCIESIEKAMDFLKGRMAPIAKYLPNDTILTPLSYFYYNNPRPNAEQELNLERFFWNVSISQRYIQGQGNKIRADIELMQRITTGHRVATIDHEVHDDEILAQKLRFSSAFCKSILCLLTTKQPLDLRNNTSINFINPFATANEKQYHHIFPKNYLNSLRGQSNYVSNIQPYIDSIANICVLTALSNNFIRDRTPSEYIEDLSSRNPQFMDTLNSHLINRDAYECIRSNDFPAFIRIRARTIREELESKLRL